MRTLLLILVPFLLPLHALAATADLSITQSAITFSESTFYEGDTVRVYAHVQNLGDVDMTATVLFYHSATVIGSGQSISMQAGGAIEEVFVDFVIPSDSFNIRAVIQGFEPADENASNNEATTPLYAVIADDDRDGVANDADNCPDIANADQRNTDADASGDACDTDDDDDGLTDAKEEDAQTDPLDADTDDDGVDDKTDTAPLVAQEPAPAEAEEPVSTPVSDSASSSNDTQTTSSTQNDTTNDTTQTDAPEEDAEADGDALARPTRAYGVLHTSPHAQFTYTQEDWNTFRFSVQAPSAGMTYAWDFGEGTRSTETDIVHDFERAGTFTVTLTSTDAQGATASDAQNVTVAFFTLHNPLVLGIVALIVLVLGGLGATLAVMHAKNRHEV